MSSPDLASVLLTLCQFCVIGAAAGCLFTVLECAFVLRFRGEPLNGSTARPPVTVLKPLHGAEPGLSRRLAQFCNQDYPAPVQIVFGTQNCADPAATVAGEIKSEFPDRAIELVVDPRLHGNNRKVGNLINMLPFIRHDVVVLSDSDVSVETDYLHEVTALLAPPHVGIVTCLYHGIGEGFWAKLSALAINSQFLPQAITGAGLGLAQYCCGVTIALRRATLDRIGGFNAFADTLADDYAIGIAVRSQGYDVVTAPFLVGHCCFEASLLEVVRHQMRAARTIRSIRPLGYAGTIIAHPWPLALIGALSGSTTANLVAAAALGCRGLLCYCVARRFALPRPSYWLLPLQDVIAFAIYLASFIGTTVHWRGSDYRVTAEGRLIERNT